jgi:chloramphenicol-sensitive protein RarD
LVKKIAPLNSLHGLTLETILLVPLALVYLIGCEIGGQGAFGHVSWPYNLLLAFTGLITAIPLLMFASGARRVTLTTIGLLQYIAPTLQFILGVFVFKEPMTLTHLLGFIIIWIALILFSAEGLITRQKSRQAEVAAVS